MKRITFIILLFTTISVTAQTELHTDNLIANAGGGVRVTEIHAKPVSAKGSIYYYDYYLPGGFTLYSGEVFSKATIRYNLKNQVVEMQLTDGTVKKVGIGDIAKLDISGIQFVNCAGYKDADAGTGFFEVIASGKAKLLKKTDLNLLDANYNAALASGSRAATYVKNTKYFVETDNTVKPFKPRKRKVLKLFPSKKAELAAFIKEHKLKVRKEADLAKVFDYYNSL